MVTKGCCTCFEFGWRRERDMEKGGQGARIMAGVARWMIPGFALPTHHMNGHK